MEGRALGAVDAMRPETNGRTVGVAVCERRRYCRHWRERPVRHADDASFGCELP